MKISGMTFTELVVACVLMGIIMVGIAGFSLAVRTVQDSASKTTILSIQTSAAIKHIARYSSLATGENSDPGYYKDTANPYPSTGFRIDVNSTPTDYADDLWVIYQTSQANPNQLVTCTRPPAAGLPPTPNTDGPCTSTEATYIVLLNTVINFNNSIVANQNELYFIINLTTRYNPSAAMHPIDNPEYTLSTYVVPLAHGL